MQERSQGGYDKDQIFARFAVENIESRAKQLLGDLDNPQSHSDGTTDVVVRMQGKYSHLSIASVHSIMVARRFKGDYEEVIRLPLEINNEKYEVELTKTQGKEPAVIFKFPYRGDKYWRNLDKTASVIGLAGLDKISQVLHLDQPLQGKS